MPTSPVPNTAPKQAPVPIRYDHRFLSLCAAVRACWQAIGSDVLLPENGGSDMPNKDCVEVCVDADRLTTYPGGPKGAEANAFVVECAKAGRYNELLTALSKSCHLN